MIHHGDLFDVLPTLPAQSVHCVVTSPPYWGLRDYGNPPRVFGGDPQCDHEWREFLRPGKSGGLDSMDYTVNQTSQQQQQCRKCAAWRGCLGLEPTPELFVDHMVQAFAEVHRVLRDDGTLWLNLGDSYSTQGGRGEARMVELGRPSARAMTPPDARGNASGTKTGDGLKPKDLVGIPWMLAFALRSWGWYLRAEIIWAKGVSFCDAYAGSVMPESVQDRPTRSHEQVFLLTKAARYFYDAEAVRERGLCGTDLGLLRGKTDIGKTDGVSWHAPSIKKRQDNGVDSRTAGDGTRNLRTVWAISPRPFAEAHFATFPPDLVIPCIKAGTSEKGVCAVCGAPWRRLVEKEPIPEDVRADFEAARQRSADDHGRDDGFTTRRPNFQRGRGQTTWEPTCDHGSDVIPATVMDCFSGAGTVGAVCAGLHRQYLGIELNAEYIQIAERRIAAVAPLFTSGLEDSA